MIIYHGYFSTLQLMQASSYISGNWQ